ncbi:MULTISPECIES: bacterial Ig-like domain-containing protein [Lactococcus]|uniref:bacterial Ig-like domain-containing protein n=1 Tax=Lactococcus TaxID=1357 RepID=UPI003854C379
MKKNLLQAVLVLGTGAQLCILTSDLGTADSKHSENNIVSSSPQVSEAQSYNSTSDSSMNSAVTKESSTVDKNKSTGTEKSNISDTQENTTDKKNEYVSTTEHLSLDSTQDITLQIEELINKTSFKDIISVFSSNLYADVPQADEFEGQKYEITDLESTYNNQIKNNSKEISQIIRDANNFEKYDENTVKKQIVLVSYLTRWGTFSDGSLFWKEIYSPKSSLFTSKQVNDINKAYIKSFTENPQDNIASKNVKNTFKAIFSEVGINLTYKQTVENYLSNVKKVSNFSDWFYKMFPGKMYKDKYEGTEYDVGIWNRGRKIEECLPYLLTQSKNSNLMLGETRGELIFSSPKNYDDNQEEADKVMMNTMKTITNILELFDRTIVDTNIMDVDKVVGLRYVLDQGHHWLDPSDSLSYELYRVAGYTGSHAYNGAVGGAGQVQLQGNCMNSYDVVSHELMHEFNNLFSANGEYLSTYVYNTTREPAAYLNIFADGTDVLQPGDIVANTSVNSIQSKNDLVNYAKNMEDTAYALDAIVGTKVLELPLEEQVKYIKIAKVDGLRGSLSSESKDDDQVKDLTLDELKQLNIKTIDDLIDNDVVIMAPADISKNILGNHGQGYGTTLTYSAFFLTNGKAHSHNHRILNTLLAYDGWEAFKIFNVSFNQAKTQYINEGYEGAELEAKASQKALQDAYGDPQITYRSIIKARYKEVIENMKSRGLLDMSYQTLLNNISLPELEHFYEYKQRKMKMYLKQTNEFANSIFENNNNYVIKADSYTSLYEAIKKNPYSTIQLTKNIKVDGEYKEQELPDFYGILDGNGHIIQGSSHSLFITLKNSEIYNLILDGSNIHTLNKNHLGALADNAVNIKILNVHVTNSVVEAKREVGSTIGKPEVGGIIGKGDNVYISNSSVQNCKVEGGYLGGMIGTATHTHITNAYTTGELSTEDTGYRIGGIIGNGSNKSSLTNAYSTMSIQEGNGILGDDYSGINDEIIVNNTLSLASIINSGYKFFGKNPIVSTWDNNYEVQENSGKTSTDFEKADVTSIPKNNISSEFFKNNLNWGSEDIWSLTNDVSSENLPYLLNDDPRNPNRDLSQLNLISDHYDAYVGDNVDLKSLIKEVKDKNGNEVSKNEVSIKGDLDTSKTGSTVINYSYNNIDKNLTINVKENKTSLIVHDSSINVGDQWTPQSNFDKATDKDGKTVDFSSIEVDKDTIDTDQAKQVKVSYSYGGVTRYAIVSIRGADNGSENSGVEPPKTPETGSNGIHNSNKDLDSGLIAQSDKDIKNEKENKTEKETEKETNKLPATNEEMSIILSVVGVSMLLGIISFLRKKYLSNKI